jgi:hypothetical protein
MAESGELRDSPSTGRRQGATGSGDEQPSEHIDLDLPADPSVLSLVRLTVGVVASRADLDIEAVDDLRLAVEELFLSLWRMTPAKPSRLRFRFSWDDRYVEVVCTFVPGRSTPNGDAGSWGEERDTAAHEGEPPVWLPAELSQQILDALVDEHGVDGEGEDVRGWVRKRRTASSA